MARYIPVYCDTCARSSLAAPTEGSPICSFCEGPARVVPGPIFRDGDWLAFAEIEQAVAVAKVRGQDAAVLAEELQQALERRENPREIVRLMIERVPALAKARPALVSALPRGLQLLMVQFVARIRATAPGDARSAH